MSCLDEAVGLLDQHGYDHLLIGTGWATAQHNPSWIYKAARPDVTIDLIFRAGGSILLDDEHMHRSSEASLDGVAVRVPCVADLATTKAVFDGSARPGRWYECVDLLRRGPVDWNYLVHRGRTYAPERVLSLVLYARSEGVAVPDDVVPAFGVVR